MLSRASSAALRGGHPGLRWGWAFVALAAPALLLGAGVRWSGAMLTSTATDGSNGFTVRALFAGARSVAAWDARDASSGTASNRSDPLSFAGDTLVKTTTAFATTFSSTRYERWDYEASLPAGLALSSASFNLRLLPSAGAETACWYLEVRRSSTNALLATHGSSGTPYACPTGTTYATTSVALPEVTTTDIANDLRIKLFADESNNKAVTIDLATILGATAYGTFNLYEKIAVDAGNGSPATTNWSLATVDATAFTSAAPWTTAFASTRYLLFTFDPGVPAGATITSATLSHVYQSSTVATSCTYFEVYSAATLVGTHGSSGTPLSCSTTNASWVTDNVTLGEVNSVARANGVQAKLYVRNSATSKTNHDQVLLTLNYYRS